MIAPALRALLEHVLDYAGLFPPANLSLEPAIQNYAAYLTGDDRWMLARFICPAVRLAELEPFLPLFSVERPLAISALIKTAPTWAEFVPVVQAGAVAARAFCQRHGPTVNVTLLEAPLSAEATQRSADDLRALLDHTAQALAASGLSPVTPFYELLLDDHWARALPTVLSAIRDHTAAGHSAGFKLRTGGTVASAFPTCEQVAAAIIAARDQAVALKFTAGLHHPLRHFNASVQTKMHGFINVFVAGVLAHACQLPQAQVVAILEDEDVAHFTFDSSGLAWRDQSASLAATQQVRASALLSFGSCSFDEPREDLRALRWFP